VNPTSHRFIYLLALLCFAATESAAQFSEEATVQAADAVLRETMATPGSQIPLAMLADAYGVAIIPNVIKGSFVVGARRGRGLLFVREANGVWHAPVFITLTGGNVGWQVGVQSSDIILVFKTPRSVQGILNGKLTLGADAAAAAGPVGRQAAVATDGRLQAEIYTYSRSRGLFAGVSIDGSVVRIDRFATSTYYRSPSPGQPVAIPPTAQQLTEAIAALVGSGLEPTAAGAAADAPQPFIAAHHGASDADVLRQQLVQLAPELYDLLNTDWQNFLALPAVVFLEGPHPDPQELVEVLQNFDRVASNPRYGELAARPEFQSFYGVLKHYAHSLVPTRARLQLPSPPASPTPGR